MEIKRIKLYDLFYNKVKLVNNQPFPVCNGKKSELSRDTRNYRKSLFEIKLHI